MKKLFLILTISTLISIVSLAQERIPKVNARQHAQHGRILQGKNSGDLTRQEASLLRREQKRIRMSERRIKADGDVTARERSRLHRQQRKANRHIYRAKNNELTSTI